MNKIEEIVEKINDADAILIGASNGLSIAEGYNVFANDERFRNAFGDFQKKYGIQSALQGTFGAYSNENEMWSYFSRLAYHYMYNAPSSPLMQSLYELVKDKPYFIVTSNADDHFNQAGFDSKNIFEIEGNLKGMQCANGCHDTIYPNQDAVLTMLKHEDGMEIPDEYLPKCPHCNGPMMLHVPINQNFVKDSEWWERYQDYQDFVERYHGKKLLILEFGIGKNNQMIKAPFMELTNFEPEATYITFNKGEVYIAPEIIEKSIGVDGDLSEILPSILETYKQNEQTAGTN